MANENVPAFVGLCPVCGGFLMAVVADEENRDIAAVAVAKAVKKGWRIEQVTVGYVRTHWVSCTCGGNGVQMELALDMEAV